MDQSEVVNFFGKHFNTDIFSGAKAANAASFISGAQQNFDICTPSPHKQYLTWNVYLVLNGTSGNQNNSRNSTAFSFTVECISINFSCKK